MTIIIKTSGGIGNQLFQYAFGRATSLFHNTNLEFDNTFYKKPPRGVTHREFLLSYYKVIINESNKNIVLDIFNNKYISSLIKKNITYNNYRYFNEKSYNKSLILDNKFNNYFDGYWQNYLYFNSIESIIREEITLQAPYLSSESILYNKIIASNSIAIHIRRGDYVSNKKAFLYHGICSIDYYESAIKYFQNKFDDCHFFVFSDDLTWAQDNLSITDCCTFIDLDIELQELRELRLMSSCNHHIISNSSFSWWGAWLNLYLDKIIIRPSPWFISSPTIGSKICPPKWIKLPI